METAVQNDLKEAGYSNFANVKMSGNVATLTGTAPSEAAMSDAVNVAKNTKCPFCKKKNKTWHEVNNKLDFKALPTQSPFSFSGDKAEDGRIALTGYVGSEDEKLAVTNKAKSIFGTSLASISVIVANGQPNKSWSRVVETDMEQLALLKKGRFILEDRSNFISGNTDQVSIRDQINASGDSVPGDYDFAANITVDGAAAVNVGEVKSEAICQSLLNDLKNGKRILFASAKANITGAESFDLLNSLASAVNQCASFRVAVGGHTDSVGDAGYNQRLSKLRADAVVAYLRDNNVDTNRLTARGYGEANPVAPNDTPQGRSNNRRIEFTVTQSQ
ncbi:MAG: OmpA family protein [Litorimonas sp.]